MTIERTHRSAILRRIADSNSAVRPGPGLATDHLVPAFTINNSNLASQLRQRLTDNDIATTIRVERLQIQFLVTREKLSTALRIRDEFLTQNSDLKPRRFSRDYDSFFLLTPFTLLAVYVTRSSPLFPQYVWVAIVVSSVTAMILAERINRQHRIHRGLQLGMRDLFVATLATAVNIITWRAVL